MKAAGSIVLVQFLFTDQSGSRLRPVLVLRRASMRFNDWLVCMITSQLQQADPHLDEVLNPDDPDFPATGLKAASVSDCRVLLSWTTDSLPDVLAVSASSVSLRSGSALPSG
jgi:hypothetical protein